MHDNYLEHFKNDGESIVVDEMSLCAGRTIADLAVINGSLHVYEIKGTFDNLNRLSKQLENYNRVFDYITVVTTKNHLTSILKHTPSHCGIWVLSNNGDQIDKVEIRSPTRNPFLESFAIAQLLWRDEALGLMEKHGIAKGFRSKRKWLLWEKISISFALNELSSEIRRIIKARASWKVSEKMVKRIP